MAAASLPGLSSAEVAAVLAQDGPNELPEGEHRGPLQILTDVLREPMLALLVAGGAIYLVLGELQDALILMVFALFSIIVTIVQEARTERVLRSLRDLTSPKALVVRNAVVERIDASGLVAGDVILLQEGDRIPADAAVVEETDLQIDESLLTGESVPVHKRAHQSGDPAGDRPGGEDSPFVFSGTLIVRGQGVARVSATGVRSEIGRIGKSLVQLQTASPRLQLETRRVTLTVGTIGAIVSVLAAILYGTLRGNWLNAALAGIALGMSMLPEEFPVVLTVFMAMGAWRISRANVLTRRATAIEALGSATVLCTDKTGTLTENRMVVSQLRLASGAALRSVSRDTLPEVFEELVQLGVLASAEEPFDPMEKALHALAEASPEWSIARTYGLRPDLLAVVQGWATGEGDPYFVAGKGAPEAIASLCALNQGQLVALREAVREMATEGLRVLGIAKATHTGNQWPDTARGFTFTFVGLVGLSDPLRKTVPDAVSLCHSAGVRVMMITGDHPQTAETIARQAGLVVSSALTGTELAKMDDHQLEEAVRSTTIFARILPEQKLRIVEALKRNGEVVAMTGDGVNDAPSLKAADIGIAMGGRGTQVAREAAAIVLLDDDFGSIVKAIELGRRIYDNLRKAMGFIIAVHIPIAGLALLPLFTGYPIVLWPIHIAFLEMIIDPVCSLAFEAEEAEADVMRRPPRPPGAALLPRGLLVWGAVQGAVVLSLIMAVFLGGHALGMPDGELRAQTYFVLVAAILGLILVNRSFSASLLDAIRLPNRTLTVVFVTVLSVLAASLAVPFVVELFGFGPLHLPDLAIVAAGGAAVVACLEAIKALRQRRIDASVPE